MKRTSSLCLLSPALLGVVAALLPAQDKSHDPLAHARTRAKAENQRVLLLLTGGEAAIMGALTKRMADYRGLGKLIRYEYQVCALPADSVPGKALAKRLGLTDLALPSMAALSTGDEVLGTLSARQMVEGGRAFLQKHACTPLDAREVLTAGLTAAKETKRQVFVYLSAPW